jgi:hypothetical protein
MELKEVRSKGAKAIGHDAVSQTAHVQFHSGAVYAYHPISEEQHRDLMNSESIMNHIRMNWPKGKKVASFALLLWLTAATALSLKAADVPLNNPIVSGDITVTLTEGNSGTRPGIPVVHWFLVNIEYTGPESGAPSAYLVSGFICTKAGCAQYSSASAYNSQEKISTMWIQLNGGLATSVPSLTVSLVPQGQEHQL